MIGKIISFIGYATMIVMIILGLVVFVPHILGFSQYVVVSGSMEPGIPVGSVVFAKPVEASELETGDVIVFYTVNHKDTPVTHRVVENRIADREVVTKGDANAGNDMSPAPYEKIVGKVIFSVPRLGYLVGPFGTVLGKFSAVMFIAAGYLLTMIGGNISGKTAGEDERQ